MSHPVVVIVIVTIYRQQQTPALENATTHSPALGYISPVQKQRALVNAQRHRVN